MSRGRSESGRVLVVDDDPLSQRLTEVMLRDLAVQVVSVGSGQEALERLRHDTFDLILLDVRMPVLDGYATCRQIRAWERQRPSAPQVPVIALSGHVTPEDRERARAAGMNDSLEKPLRIKKLHAMVRHWLVPGESSPMERGMDETERHVPFDPDVLERLRRELVMAPGAFANILGLFLEQTPPTLSRMRQFAIAGEREALARAAHGMKSQCAALGAQAMRALFVRLEHWESPVDDPAGMIALLDEVEVLFLRCAPLLEQARSHPKAVVVGFPSCSS
ncbi:MAG: response regulator [Magnetococcales bacterium]|nr:response regulator [Magnetococcales bacterium]